jgi:cytochrome c oxidase subunit IV
MATNIDTHSEYADGHDDHGGHAHHITPVSKLLVTYGWLLVFMVLTVVASKWNLGVMNNAVAMAIAITKAVLVVLIFMGVKYGTKLTWLWAALGFIWFLLMFGILSDYISREWVPIAGWQQAVR